MHARIDDPIGPIWLRASPLLVAFALVAGFVAVAIPYGLAREAMAAALLLGAVVLAVPTLLPRVAPRDALVVPGDGYIDVMNAGLLSQRIRTRDVIAASAARTMGGAAIALVPRGRRRRPLVLDFENGDDVQRVRDALGVGHFGCGTLEWTTARGDVASATKLLRLLAAISLAAFAYAFIDAPRSNAVLLGGLLLPTVPLAIIMMAGALLQITGPPPPPVPARAWDLANRGEPGRSWFARIDAFARSFTSGYRGASFDADDLWATLENHDAPADLRVAAARFLVRVSATARPRVDAILARVRDNDARDKLRAAMREDIDDAGEAIDRISARESGRGPSRVAHVWAPPTR